MAMMAFQNGQLMSAEELERLAPGANAPPPHETFAMHIDELFAEAAGFLDGEPIANDGQAEAVSRLLEMARLAKRDADEQRKKDKAPHDAAASAVQELWRPIISRAELTADTCKQALAPWLKLKDDEMRAVAEAAAQEARDKAAAARALHDAAGTDLTARETAERALKDANKAATAATRADRAKPQATGGSRAVGLRTVWSATITDRKKALLHYIAASPEEFVTLIQSLADNEARLGPRTAAGIEFKSEQKV